MHSLPETHYKLIVPLLQEMNDHLISRSILAKQTPAQIFVNNIETPQTLFAIAGHRLITAGDPYNPTFNQSIQKHIIENIIPPATQHNMDALVIYCANPAWEAQLDQWLPEYKHFFADREYYQQHQASPVTSAPTLPEDIQIKVITPELLETQLQHLETLQEEMKSERPSIEDFLAKSFGVCAIHQNELAGWCLSEYNLEDRCEIGIETTQAYRQRGIATAMTKAFLEQAHVHGITQIGWHCFKRNIPSSQTARKAGFQKKGEYKSLIILLKE